jgi:glycosyltransferase involved in cell wall biosynthesis
LSDIEYSIILPYFERPRQLKASLESFSNLYKDSAIEVIIIDDGSSDEGKPVIPSNLGFEVTLLTIKFKDGINPCVPYNVGVRYSRGRVLILSSPETCHIRNIFHETAWELFQESTYILFPVFAVTNIDMNKRIADAQGKTELEHVFVEIRGNESALTEPLGHRGYTFASPNGSWYCHPIHRPTGLNFLSALTKSSYERMGGFDERYRFGTGYDDMEFRDRLRRTHEFRYASELAGLHLEHEIVADKPSFKRPINSNRRLYVFSKIFPRFRKNSWGKSKVTVQHFDA